jgi:hypothetical protein
MHTGQERDIALEPSHHVGQGAMEALWKDEATWELEDAMKMAYPFLFSI